MPESSAQAEEQVLTDLAHKLVDQVALYGLAHGRALDPRVAAAIQRAKDAQAHLLQDINAKIWLHGIGPIDQGTKLGAAHKAFQRLQETTEKSDTLAIGEVERGEEYLHDRVSKAIQDERLTAHTRNYLQTVLSRIDATRTEISQLKQSGAPGETSPDRANE